MAKLPAAPRRQIADHCRGHFRQCVSQLQLLNSVSAPGCRQFGYKAFAECCSLQWVYAAEGVANRFSDDTKFGHYLFKGCINLAEFTLRELHSSGGGVPQTAASDLALGCLSSTGITMLTLTQGFSVIGAHACDSCHLLKKVAPTRKLKNYKNSHSRTALASRKSASRRPCIPSGSKPS